MDALCCSSRLVQSLSSVVSTSASSSLEGKYCRRSFASGAMRGADLDSRVGIRCGGATRCCVVMRQNLRDSSVSQVDATAKWSASQDEKSGLWNGVSRTGVICVASTLLANAICGNGCAAAEASTVVSDQDSNLMFIFICVAEAVALTGAAVGGVLARQRKLELEKINAQLRQINLNLRRQSRVESYAPSLTYAPVGSARVSDSEVMADPVREELMRSLRSGKRWLREQNPSNAFEEFQKALVLAQQLKDTAEEKKAARGLGAACQRQGRYKEAIKYQIMILKISERTQEGSGNTEAYGAIADCYTELGDLETAAKYYDLYIGRLENDDTV